MGGGRGDAGDRKGVTGGKEGMRHDRVGREVRGGLQEEVRHAEGGKWKIGGEVCGREGGRRKWSYLQ